MTSQGFILRQRLNFWCKECFFLFLFSVHVIFTMLIMPAGCLLQVWCTGTGKCTHQACDGDTRRNYHENSWSCFCNSQQGWFCKDFILSSIRLVRTSIGYYEISIALFHVRCYIVKFRIVNGKYNWWYFNRLVEKINVSIGQDPNSKSLIGVLDIYGFESFKCNR